MSAALTSMGHEDPVIGLGWRKQPKFWLGRHSSSWEESDGCNAVQEGTRYTTFYVNSDGTRHGGMRAASCYSTAIQVFLDATHDDIFQEYDIDVMVKLGGVSSGFAAGFAEDVFDSISQAGKAAEVAKLETEEEQQAAAAFAASVLARMHEQLRESDDGDEDDGDEDDEEGKWCVTPIEAVVALDVLRRLPPRIAVVHHDAVAALVSDDDLDLSGMAMHTLGCLGPQAVAEHFEKIADRVANKTATRSSRRGIDGAAVLTISVLQPEHLQRLEARGAPSLLDLVRHLDEEHSGGHPVAVMGRRQLSLTMLVDGMLATMAQLPDARNHGPCCISADVVTDPESMLVAFSPSLPRWSAEGHAAFPAGARARAVELLLIGCLLCQVHGYLSRDVWVTLIMPLAIDAHSLPGGRRPLTPSSDFAAEVARRRAAKEAREAAEAAKLERKLAERQAKKELKRARQEATVGATLDAGPPPAKQPGGVQKCTACNDNPFASACQQRCCGKCCPGPCARHKR